jgi:methionyl-tRNA formyltransferase
MAVRVVIVTQDDPFYVPHFFRSFFEAIPPEVSIDSVFLLDPFAESRLSLARRLFDLYGPVGFLRRAIEYLIRKGLTQLSLADYSVKAIARENQVPIRHCDSVNTEHFVDFLHQQKVDIVLSVSAPEIFDSEVLDAPQWGCLNVHTAKLPRYRGMLPTFWALYHGEDEIGVTVHTMAESIDRGEAVRQTAFKVEADETLDDVIIKGKKAGGRLAAAALEDVVGGSVTTTPLEGEGSYFSFPTRANRREFQRRGGKLL